MNLAHSPRNRRRVASNRRNGMRTTCGIIAPLTKKWTSGMASLACGAVLGVVLIVWLAPAAHAQDASHEAGNYGVGKKSRKAGERAYGREGDARKVTRTIKITMSDAMRYFPDHTRVKRG